MQKYIVRKYIIEDYVVTTNSRQEAREVVNKKEGRQPNTVTVKKTTVRVFGEFITNKKR